VTGVPLHITQNANIDCLSIFLAPISLDEYSKRLKAWMTESDEEVAARIEAASQEMEAAKKTIGKKAVEGGGIVFDHILVNKEVRLEPLTLSCLHSLEFNGASLWCRWDATTTRGTSFEHFPACRSERRL